MTDAPQPDRPEMPDSFGVGAAGAPFEPIAWLSFAAQVAAARNYWISTTRPDGRPHAVPVWGVWLEGVFYFLTDANSLTAKNLAGNANAVVHLESGDDVAILFGAFEQAALEAGVLKAFNAKYEMPPVSEGFPVYRMRLSKAMAWREDGFPANATRWRF